MKLNYISFILSNFGQKYADPLRWIYALVPAAILAVLYDSFIDSWVIPEKNPRTPYYTTSLFTTIKPRALTATFAHLLHVTKDQFTFFLHDFQSAWIFLLLLTVFRCLRGLILPFMLSSIFILSSLVFLSNSIGTFVDMVAALLMLAGIFMVAYPTKPSGWKLSVLVLLATFMFMLSILTHEKSIFIILPLMGWCILRYKWHTVIPCFLLTISCAVYAYVIHNRIVSGETLEAYWHILLNYDKKAYIASGPFNAVGIFSSVGMVWVLYAILSYVAVRNAQAKEKWLYALLFIGTVVANLATLLVAGDTQRMCHGMWAMTYLLLIDQRHLINHMHHPIKRMLVSYLAILNIMIPPYFIFGSYAVPLNCYAKASAPYIMDYHGIKMLMLRIHDGRIQHHKCYFWKNLFAGKLPISPVPPFYSNHTNKPPH
jgi:hypothetical protein